MTMKFQMKKITFYIFLCYLSEEKITFYIITIDKIFKADSIGSGFERDSFNTSPKGR